MKSQLSGSGYYKPCLSAVNKSLHIAFWDCGNELGVSKSYGSLRIVSKRIIVGYQWVLDLFGAIMVVLFFTVII